jgi:RNA 3'-terminal phosphate cyclase (ATP)
MLAVENMIRIDGAQGEGGGQMLRTSLSLSLITGQPFQIENIRAGRKKPGLLRQHLAAVLAASEIGDAELEGAHLGSQSLSFRPKTVKPGDYRFVIGTAGSGTLVFQTVLPALMLASGPSTLVIEGGTHNQGAPPFDFLDRTFLPFIRRMGPQVNLCLQRYGFYPAGGGCFRAEIAPYAKLTPLTLGVRRTVIQKRVTALVANLSGQIARREIDTAVHMLSAPVEGRLIDTKESPGPGNVVMVEIESDEVTEIFTAFGEIGITAENVARQAVREARDYLVSDTVAGEHLTDQLLLPFALAGEGSFTASKWNQHAATNVRIIRQFLPVRFNTHDSDHHTRVQVQLDV